MQTVQNTFAKFSILLTSKNFAHFFKIFFNSAVIGLERKSFYIQSYAEDVES